MTKTAREKFASQADSKILETLRKIAKEDGRQLQAVLEDAMVVYIEHRKSGAVRSSVLTHFYASLAKNRRLGELLAK